MKLQLAPRPQDIQPPFDGYAYDTPPSKIQELPRQPPPPQFNGYHYPPPPSKLQEPSKFAGYNYEQPPVKLQEPPKFGGYNYDPPPVRLQEPSKFSGYNYDPPPVKLQEPSKFNGYNYDPPPQKLQEPSKFTGYNYDPPPVKLQEPSKFNGYNYDPPPVKLQLRPPSLNDLVSSAAAPTVFTSYGAPANGALSQQQNIETFPCNKVPWLPIFPSETELNMLRAKLQARNPVPVPSPSSPSSQNIEQFTRAQATQVYNAHTYLPPRNQRPLRQPSIASLNSLNTLPVQSTTIPFRSSPTYTTNYFPPQRYSLPLETTQHNLVPIPVPNLSVTPIPPLYEPKPFSPLPG